jgi:hypothetical protein
MAILTEPPEASRSLAGELAELLEQPGRTDFDRMVLHFALGKLHDDMGEYAEAIAHYDEGNRIEGRRLKFDRGAFAGEIDRLVETFTPACFAAQEEQATRSELPLLIVGLPRSGTTLVEQIVSAHPRVAAGGELTFWSEADPATDVSTLATDYLALLRRAGPDAARVTDKNPFNFLHMGLVHAALPQARFIHCRRNPIDTCLSIFFTRFATPQPFAYSRDDLVFYFRQYERLMAHWRAVLPPERFLEVDYEALIGDREQVTRGIIAFCGLDWDDACLRPEHNNREVRTASLWQARQPVYATSVARWRHYEPWLGELRGLLPASAATGSIA